MRLGRHALGVDARLIDEPLRERPRVVLVTADDAPRLHAAIVSRTRISTSRE
jgi:hypothetical protein